MFMRHPGNKDVHATKNRIDDPLVKPATAAKEEEKEAQIKKQ